MNTYARTFHTLISGEIICSASYPDLYRYITEDAGIEALGETFEDLGMKIASSTGGRAFYLSWQDGSEEARKAIVSQARPLQEEIARIGAFVSFMLEMNDANGPLSMGDLVRAADIAREIDHSASLRESLNGVAIALAAKGATDHSKISGVLTKLKDMGYLKQVHREREEYVVTGRIGFFEDVYEHFASHIGSVEVLVAQQEQGSFLE